MATARDIINSSLRLIGALASGETAQAADLTNGLTTLNELIESWSTESLFIYAITEESFTFVANTGQYTMGSGATFDTTRPVRFESVAVVDGSPQTSDIPIKIITSKEWAELQGKNEDSTFPLFMYPEGTYPNETLNFWPVPSAAKTVKIWSQKPVSSFSGLSVEASLPPGYLRALKYNLAIDLSPEYGKEITVTIDRVARESKANIKRKNIKGIYLKADPAVLPRNGLSTYDYRLGE